MYQRETGLLTVTGDEYCIAVRALVFVSRELLGECIDIFWCGVLMQVKRGESFESDTDTEVIPKLCNYVYSQLKTRVPFAKV